MVYLFEDTVEHVLRELAAGAKKPRAVYVCPSTDPFPPLAPVQAATSRVVSALVDQNVGGFLWGPLARSALKTAWWFKKGSAVESVMKTVRADLTERGLMAPR